MHLTYPVSPQHTSDVLPASAGEAGAPDWPTWLPKTRPVFVGVDGVDSEIEYTVTIEADGSQPSNATFSHPKGIS
jgi:hypothetical protein